MSEPLLPGTQTTGGTWVRIISECLKDAGVDPQPLFAQAGIDYQSAIQPDARIPDARLRELYPLCIAATGIESFNLYLGNYVRAHSFHALGLSILASQTVDDALQRFRRHSAIISDSGHIDITYTGDLCRFELNVYRDIQSQRLLPVTSIEAFLFGVVNLLREITDDRELSPVQVQLCSPQPVDVTPYTEAFKCPVEFGADREMLVFRRSDTERPVRYANESLARQQDQITEAFIKSMSPDFEDEIYRQIIKELPNGELSAEKLASRLNMSLRKLQGKLQQHNTSYQQLLDKARMELARKYLNDTHYNLTEITFLLGFANSAGFCRAFKRWFDMSPTEFRKMQTGT